MGHKQSKAKKELSSGSTKNDKGEYNVEGGNKGKLKKKSHIRRKLTKAFTKKPSKYYDEPETTKTTYATKETLKRTNSAGSLASPTKTDTPSNTKKINVVVSTLQSQSITPITTPPRYNNGTPIQRSETLATPHVSHTTPPATQEEKDTSVSSSEGVDQQEDGEAEVGPPTTSENNGEGFGRKRAASTSSFIRYGSGGRAVALPKRMSKAYAFHQQLATKELADRGAELQKIMDEEKPICDIFEENPFKKGWCRLCKHAKSVHRDPYNDIMDELMEGLDDY